MAVFSAVAAGEELTVVSSTTPPLPVPDLSCWAGGLADKMAPAYYPLIRWFFPRLMKSVPLNRIVAKYTSAFTMNKRIVSS